MTRINSELLSDTLNLVQLARETALARGKQAQAERLSPVVNELKTLANVKRETPPSAPSSVMAQNDFRTLLSVAGSPSSTPPAAAATTNPTRPVQPAQSMGGGERNRMVLAMAAGNMRDVEIARQLGMTIDEVQMVVSASQKGSKSMEVRK
jgi:hypothetical protein